MHYMGYQVEKGHTVGPHGPSKAQAQLQRACWIRILKSLEYNSPNLIRYRGGFIPPPEKGGRGNPPLYGPVIWFKMVERLV